MVDGSFDHTGARQVEASGAGRAAYPVAIDVGSEVGPRGTQAGDVVTLTYDGSQTVDVCLPEITGYGVTTLYVGADGSTYTDINLCLLAQGIPPLSVNFQPAQATPPAGYTVDDGSPYGTHGEHDYGWQ